MTEHPTDGAASGADQPDQRDRTGHSRVLLGVTGGIAAYKACELLRRLTESGHDVTVIPTESAQQFVGTATWEALSGRPVATSLFEHVEQVQHVWLGQQADLIVVAPATADLIARAANGRADDLLAATLLVARCPVVLAPAMHTEMWEHPATRANVSTLRARGVVVIDPAYGRLTGTDTGPGRLPDAEEIFQVATDVLARGQSADDDLSGRRVVVSAGGTREYLDPVRYLGNRSSGKQGYALARAAAARGADVTVVAANVDLPDPAGAKVVPVVSALELQEAVLAASAGADAVVMAAAPADFRPVQRAGHKIKKQPGATPPDVALAENPDILAGLVAKRGSASRPVLVGFAAETGDAGATVLEHGRAKLQRKGCDVLVVNDVSAGAVFGADHNQAVILTTDGSERTVPTGSKLALAHVVWDVVAQLVDELASAAAGDPEAPTATLG